MKVSRKVTKIYIMKINKIVGISIILTRIHTWCIGMRAIFVIIVLASIRVGANDHVQSEDDQGYCVMEHAIEMKVNMNTSQLCIAESYLHLNDYRNSPMYLEAKEREKLAHESNLAHWYQQAGNDYKYAGDNAKALEMFSKAAPKYQQEALERRDVGQYSAAAQRYLGAADCYNELNNPEMVIKMREKAALEYEFEADTIKNSGNPSFAWYYYQIAAETYQTIGNNTKAIEMYNKAADGLVVYGDHSESWRMRYKAEKLQEAQKQS